MQEELCCAQFDRLKLCRLEVARWRKAGGEGLENEMRLSAPMLFRRDAKRVKWGAGSSGGSDPQEEMW
jgi:hypothetical protein